jgi:hypothetical protein
MRRSPRGGTSSIDPDRTNVCLVGPESGRACVSILARHIGYLATTGYIVPGRGTTLGHCRVSVLWAHPLGVANILCCLRVTARIRDRGLSSLAHYVYETSDGEGEVMRT